MFAFAKDLAAGKDRITDFGADDFIVSTVQFRDGNRDGIITYSKNKAFELTQGRQHLGDRIERQNGLGATV